MLDPMSGTGMEKIDPDILAHSLNWHMESELCHDELIAYTRDQYC